MAKLYAVLNFRVPVPSWGSKGRVFRFVSSSTKLPDGVDRGQSRLLCGVEGEAAPGPVSGVGDQLALQRVHMHVVQFFDSFFQTPNVEVIKAELPEAAGQLGRRFEAEPELACRRSLPAAQAARNALLERLHDGRGRSFGRLADEQVHVLGHHHEAHQSEAVTLAHLGQNLNDNIFGARRAE